MRALPALVPIFLGACQPQITAPIPLEVPAGTLVVVASQDRVALSSYQPPHWVPLAPDGPARDALPVEVLDETVDVFAFHAVSAALGPQDVRVRLASAAPSHGFGDCGACGDLLSPGSSCPPPPAGPNGQAVRFVWDGRAWMSQASLRRCDIRIDVAGACPNPAGAVLGGDCSGG